jgi:metal-responsive CopG/Arc/MetJ family transcriptional regulator
MAMRKMTFTIPDEIATPFLREVPAARRSEVVAEALKRTLASRKTKQEQDAELVAACDAVNADPELNALMDDWQAASDPIEEPWNEPAPR